MKIRKPRYGWVNNYCEKVDDYTFRCLICEAKIKVQCNSNGNIKKHIRRKHPDEYWKECKGRLKKLYLKNNDTYDDVPVEQYDGSDRDSVDDMMIGSAQDINTGDNDDSSYEQSANEEEIDEELEKKIRYLCNKSILGCKSNRKTCIWNFFKNVRSENENVYKCTFCLKNISVDRKNVSNLKRHIKRCHSQEYSRILEHAPANDSLHHQVTRRSSKDKSIDENENDSVDCFDDNLQEVEIEKLLIWPKKQPNDEEQNCDELESKIINLCNKPVLGKVKSKTCIWNFFNNVCGDTVFRCTFCSKDITIFPKSVANLTRHITRRHPEIFQQISKHAPVDDSLFRRKTIITNKDDENIKLVEKLRRRSNTSLNDETVEMIKELCYKSVSGKHSNKSCIWNFFESVNPTVYKCMFCKREIACKFSGAGNLHRHVKNIHQKEYEAIIQYAPSKDSLHRAGSLNFLKVLSSSEAPETLVKFDKAYFDELEDGSFLCKQCDETIKCNDEEQDLLFSHIQVKHPDQIVMYQEQTTENDEGFSVFIVKK